MARIAQKYGSNVRAAGYLNNIVEQGRSEHQASSASASAAFMRGAQLLAH